MHVQIAQVQLFKRRLRTRGVRANVKGTFRWTGHGRGADGPPVMSQCAGKDHYPDLPLQLLLEKCAHLIQQFNQGPSQSLMEQKHQKPTVVMELHYLSDLSAIYHNRDRWCLSTAFQSLKCSCSSHQLSVIIIIIIMIIKNVSLVTDDSVNQWCLISKHHSSYRSYFSHILFTDQ